MIGAAKTGKGLSQGGLSELKSRLLFVFIGILIFRIGSYIPVPGLDPSRMAHLFSQHESGLLGMFNMFSGGALSRLTIFALGVAQSPNYSTHRIDNLNLDTAFDDANLAVSAFAFVIENVSVWYSNQTTSLNTTAQADVNFSTTVDEDLVKVDGTITSTIVTVSDTAEGLLKEIKEKCEMLDVDSFEGLGALEDYKSLVVKARQIGDSTSILSGKMGDIDMLGVTALSAEVADILEDLTLSLNRAVTIEDEGVLTKIRDFLEGFTSLQTNLQKFALQISITNTISVPESIGEAATHLAMCKGKVDSVMEKMKFFAGVTGATEFTIAPQRQKQIDEALVALNAIQTLGDEIVTNYEDESVNQILEATDGIKNDTSASLVQIKAALEDKDWLTGVSQITLPQ